MKALLTLATFTMVAGGSSLSAQCQSCPFISEPCCPPQPCPIYTCAGSPEYQDYWRNQVYYQGSSYMNGNNDDQMAPSNEDRNMKMNYQDDQGDQDNNPSMSDRNDQ